jgi:tRNA-Thr(GGU) m(6)t(6)A37 methyltransferase TsaA
MKCGVLTYKPIGIVHSPFKDPNNVPIQAVAAKGTKGKVEVFDEYLIGLQGLEGFSHIILLYEFHLVKACALIVKPFLDDDSHGIFATRSPARPNKIGLSVVRLVGLKGNCLHIEDVDIIDGTPLIDIKPFVPAFDCRDNVKIGWFTEKICKLEETKDDGRFCN